MDWQDCKLTLKLSEFCLFIYLFIYLFILQNERFSTDNCDTKKAEIEKERQEHHKLLKNQTVVPHHYIYLLFYSEELENPGFRNESYLKLPGIWYLNCITIEKTYMEANEDDPAYLLGAGVDMSYGKTWIFFYMEKNKHT